MKMIVKEDIKDILKDAFEKQGVTNKEIDVKFSQMEKIADFQCNDCFKFAKEVQVNPFELAENVVKSIKLDNDYFEFSVSKPAFINVKITNAGLSYYANTLKRASNLGVTQDDKVKTIVMDYGGANVAKALHVGHLRSPIIGESLKRLLKLKGHKVISDVHFGDYGLQMGLTVAQLQEDNYLNYYFGKSNEKPKITLDILNEEYPKASARKKDESFKKKADDLTLYIQEAKEPYFTIYKDIREVSVKEIIKYYKALNCEFDLLLGESDVGNIIDDVVGIFEKKGLARKSEGAIVCDVSEENENVPVKTESGEILMKNPMPPVMLAKSNGGAGYAITDIATVFQRNKSFNPDEIIYVADFRQQQHFTQFFRACKKAGISPENQKLTLVKFGTINGKDGKPFKTRSGDTVKLEDVYNMVIEKATEKLKENGIENDTELAREIGVSALKFGDLINTVSKDYVFDLDKFMSFDGKTGPYLQYNGARIKSILKKANCSLGEIKVQTEEERKIVITIFKLIESYDICENSLSLNSLCLSLYDVASAFALLYNNINILKEQNEERKKSLLSLCKFVLDELTLGLNTLAIDMPEKM